MELTKNLQALLAQNEEHEIDQIGGQPMEEHHIDIMMESVGGYAAIRIPETRLHWILIANLFAQLNDFAPLHLAMIGARYIIDGHIHRPFLRCKLIRYDA